MKETSRRIQWLVWTSLFLTIVAIAGAFVVSELRKQAASGISLPMLSPLPEFTLTNQIGQPVTLADLRGQVWVADIIFTSCAGPCPVMTKQMSELQNALPANNFVWPVAPLARRTVKLVTLTTHPEVDTPEVLKRYGQRFKADFSRWMFLTGSKQQLARLARDGLKLVTEEKTPEERTAPEDLFIHSTLFVIVDKQGRLRASFENEDPHLKKKVIGAVRQLLREDERKK